MIGALLLGGAGVAIYGVIKNHDEFNAKAAKYRETIERASGRYGIDRHILAALLWQESRFNPQATGKAGEIGMAQALPIAVRDSIVNGYSAVAGVSELYDPEKAIDFAGFFLRLALTRTGGSMSEALRAYNAGYARSKADRAISQGYAGSILSNALIDSIYQQFNLGKTVA